MNKRWTNRRGNKKWLVTCKWRPTTNATMERWDIRLGWVSQSTNSQIKGKTNRTYWYHTSSGILGEIFGQPPTNCNKSKLNRFWFLDMSSVTEKKVLRDPPEGMSWNHGNPIWPPPGFAENEQIVKIDILICKYMFFCILIVCNYGQYIDIQE